jgi:hypothetical protein
VLRLPIFLCLILCVTLAAPQTCQAAANSKSVFPASLISKKITLRAGIYNAETKLHDLSSVIAIDDIGSWRKFADKIKDMPVIKDEVEIEDFMLQNFILIKEIDRDGFITAETIFSPGLIQQKIVELTFKLRSKDSRSFFLDMLELQMSCASY